MTTPNTEPKPATDAEIATRRKPFHERLGPQWEDQLVARIEQEREMRRELSESLRRISTMTTSPGAGIAREALARAAKMEEDFK